MTQNNMDLNDMDMMELFNLAGFPSDNASLPPNPPASQYPFDMSQSSPDAGFTPSYCDNSSPTTQSQPQSPPRQLSVQPDRRPSTSRVLVPSSTNNVSPHQNGQGPPALGGGPTSKQHSIPPRPKPGRKPATDEPASKRKAQNRDSQRAFRQRKAAKMTAIKNELDVCRETFQARRDHQDTVIAALQEDNQREKRAKEIAQEERDYWKRMYVELREQPHVSNLFNGEQVLFHGSGFTNEMHAVFQDPMPPVPLPRRRGSLRQMVRAQSGEGLGTTPARTFAKDDMEIDFTAQFQQHVPTTMPSADMTQDHDCGFCANNKDICVCESESVRPVGLDGMTTLSEDVKPAPVMTGPGSCPDCQTNPRKRELCQRVAQLRSEATPPRSRRSSAMSNSLDVMEPKVETRLDLNKALESPSAAKRAIGCSDAFNLLDGRVPMDVDHMAWRNLRPVPHTSTPQDARKDTFTMEPGTFSAMELDASSILTTLQHSRRPLEPRPSDGNHAQLIREAEERRRATMPRTPPEDQGEWNTDKEFDMET